MGGQRDRFVGCGQIGRKGRLRWVARAASWRGSSWLGWTKLDGNGMCRAAESCGRVRAREDSGSEEKRRWRGRRAGT
jgi:hypothetical protein